MHPFSKAQRKHDRGLRTLAVNSKVKTPRGQGETTALLPRGRQLTSLLLRLGFTERDRTAVEQYLPEYCAQPRLRQLLEHSCQRLVTSIGRAGKLSLAPPEEVRLLGPAGGLFAVFVFLSAVEDIRRYHRSLGIPGDVSWHTLADLGRQVDTYYRLHGTVGFEEEEWLSLHFRGLVFQLGRLQFERWVLPPGWGAGTCSHEGLKPGGKVLNIHIPETGPLLPSACDASLTRAARFFPQHFERETYSVAVCNSWLLDQQLAEYLPASSNIIQFQHRFTIAPGGRPDDDAVIRFVFRAELGESAGLRDLPQSTTLERSIVNHIRAGRQWRICSGWLPLEFAECGKPDGGGAGAASRAGREEEM